jgi:hypothetical protein
MRRNDDQPELLQLAPKTHTTQHVNWPISYIEEPIPLFFFSSLFRLAPPPIQMLNYNEFPAMNLISLLRKIIHPHHFNVSRCF